MDRLNELKEQMKWDQAAKSDQDRAQYEKLFDELAQEPGSTLHADFAKEVLDRLDRIEGRKRLGFYLLMVVGVGMATLITVGYFFYVYGERTMALFEGVINWAVLIGVLLVTIQYLDNRLVRKRSLALD